MRPQRRGQPTLVADLLGGEFVRVAAGPVRITHRVRHGVRWAILLRPDLSETDDFIWLAGNTPVLEVLEAPAQRQVADGEVVDPLRMILEDVARIDELRVEPRQDIARTKHANPKPGGTP